MKHIILTIIFLVLGALNISAQDFKIQGNTFVSTKTARVSTPPERTPFRYKDSKGNDYPIYISESGSCFVIKYSQKKNKDYKNYLGSDMSTVICNKLGREYKGKKK